MHGPEERNLERPHRLVYRHAQADADADGFKIDPERRHGSTFTPSPKRRFKRRPKSHR